MVCDRSSPWKKKKLSLCIAESAEIGVCTYPTPLFLLPFYMCMFHITLDIMLHKNWYLASSVYILIYNL